MLNFKLLLFWFSRIIQITFLYSLTDVESWLISKDPDAGKDWGQEEERMTEDEMVGWHHWLNGHGFACTRGVGDGQGGLACCSSWGCRESDMTERLNWTELNMAQPIKTRTSFPLSQFLPSGSFHKLLIPIPQRADRMKTTITENKSNRSYGPQPCLTQWN